MINMEAVMCDRCKKVVKSEEAKKVSTNIETQSILFGKIDVALDVMDLCPDCHKQLISWLLPDET